MQGRNANVRFVERRPEGEDATPIQLVAMERRAPLISNEQKSDGKRRKAEFTTWPHPSRKERWRIYLFLSLSLYIYSMYIYIEREREREIVCMYMYMCMYVCIYMCTYIHIYMYIVVYLFFYVCIYIIYIYIANVRSDYHHILGSM